MKEIDVDKLDDVQAFWYAMYRYLGGEPIDSKANRVSKNHKVQK